MSKGASNALPYELLASLRNPLASSFLSVRTIQLLYIRSAKIVSKRSSAFLITAIPAVRRQLRWAVLLAFLRAYVAFMKRVIMDPQSMIERSMNKNGGWILLMAVKERIRAQFKSKESGSAPTSPKSNASRNSWSG